MAMTEPKEHPSFFVPLEIDTRIKVTVGLIFAAHVISAVGLFLIWMDRELLPLPWVWWNLQVMAAIFVGWFMLKPARGTCAAAGAMSAVAFGGRALAYLWAMLYRGDTPLVERLGYRVFTAFVLWTVVAVMDELLWWWVAGARDQVPRGG